MSNRHYILFSIILTVVAIQLFTGYQPIKWQTDVVLHEIHFKEVKVDFENSDTTLIYGNLNDTIIDRIHCSANDISFTKDMKLQSFHTSNDTQFIGNKFQKDT